jgi:hypothetical protein
MVNQNTDSLRKQIIDAMTRYALKRQWAGRSIEFNIDMFDEAIMPVLDAAMKAGELLLHRATTPMKPINEGIVDWLDSCCLVIATVRPIEPTVSKRELLHILYQLEEGATVALSDARRCNQETTSGALGNLLAGQSLPVKG